MQQGTKKEGWEKITDLQLYNVLSQKLYKLVPKLLQNVNIKSYAIHWMVSSHFQSPCMSPEPNFIINMFILNQYLKKQLLSNIYVNDHSLCEPLYNLV